MDGAAEGATRDDTTGAPERWRSAAIAGVDVDVRLAEVAGQHPARSRAGVEPDADAHRILADQSRAGAGLGIVARAAALGDPHVAEEDVHAALVHRDARAPDR